LREAANVLEAAVQFHCDVASESSVAQFAVEVLEQYAALDAIINAAGGGYARTLGMYRVSRALMPALGRGTNQLLINIPPSQRDADMPTFPYASSRLAFHRLSSALAFEARGTAIEVLIACPAKRRLMQVWPDPNAGNWAEDCSLLRPSREDILALAWQVASLLDASTAPRRHAG
jgi:NAD(P)-dependent dehydrogenase (short-subunit alcohol dehydrogenase family)